MRAIQIFSKFSAFPDTLYKKITKVGQKERKVKNAQGRTVSVYERHL